jgi:DNA-binding NtrC family response regulator
MDAAVLIYGEAGTGKSLIARTIHLKSARSSGPFIPVDLGALSEREAEIALFGAECGGEGEGRPGAFTKAQGGTLVLDEIGALTPTLQTKLLSVLETGFCPDGGARVDVRLISATRRLRQDVRDRLQDDLLYRLNTVEISVPPLRDRGGDIELLAAHFLRLYANRYARAVKVLAPEAAAAVREAPWPGEVRALRQAMERCVIFAEGAQIEIADLPLFDEADPVSSPRRSDVKLIESERALISGVLKRHNFNVSHAAKQLGLSRAALYRRMAKHGL